MLNCHEIPHRYNVITHTFKYITIVLNYIWHTVHCKIGMQPIQCTVYRLPTNFTPVHILKFVQYRLANRILGFAAKKKKTHIKIYKRYIYYMQ